MVVNGASTTLFIGTLLGYKVGIELDLTNKKYFFLCHVLRCHPYKWDDDDSQRGGFSITKEWLVGGLEHFIFFHILGIIIPTDFHIFQRGCFTTNQMGIDRPSGKLAMWKTPWFS